MQFNKDMKSEHKELFHKARGLILSFDNVKETKKERITTYSKNGCGLCHMRTMPYGIDFGFLKGATLEDKYNLLTGSGKLMRVLPLKFFDKEIITYYFTQALELIKK